LHTFGALYLLLTVLNVGGEKMEIEVIEIKKPKEETRDAWVQRMYKIEHMVTQLCRERLVDSQIVGDIAFFHVDPEK